MKSFWLKVFREKFFLGKNVCGKYPEKVLEKKVSAKLAGKKYVRKKFLPGKVFGGKFPRESCFAEKMFAESTRKKFWKKKFPQSWPEKNMCGKSFYLEKFLAKGKNGFGSRKLKRRNDSFFAKERTNTRTPAGQLYRKLQMLARNQPSGGIKIRINRNERPKKRNECPKNSRFPAKNRHF